MMNNLIEFLKALSAQGIELWAEGDQLHWDAPTDILTPKQRAEPGVQSGALRSFVLPTDILTPKQRAELIEHKEEILQFLQKNTLAPIQPVHRAGEISLSFAQQRLWLLDQFEGGSSAAYNIHTALRLLGPLHFTALAKSLLEIVQRHETLRTTFSMKDGKPVQVIHQLEGFSYQLSVINLQELPVEKQDFEEQRLINEEIQRPFDLSNLPLFRTRLLQKEVDSHILLLTLHNIISDDWSIGTFIRELATLYEAISRGQPSPLPKLDIQYADFAHWQRQWLAGKVLETQLNYWQKQLADAPPVLEIPSDHPRPSVQTFRGGTEGFEITPELTKQLKDLSQQTDVTLFMILLAAFALLLERYSGQEELVIGSPIVNRNRKQIKPLIGLFVNTLALRIDLSETPTFLDLLGRVRQVTLDAYAHQALPFEQLVETLQPKQALNREPLVQVQLAFQEAPLSAFELSDLILSPVMFRDKMVRFDLELHLWEVSEQLHGHFFYYKELFEPTTLKRMSGHFQTLLASIATNPELPISDYSLLNQAERHQLLVEWNNTDTNYLTDKCIHQLFEAQVEKTPEAVAVVFENQQLTYRELNTKANQLAHYLQTFDVKADVLVGLCIERSGDMVIGLLGILKAGSAYLPLDPTYPPNRLAFMLNDAEVSVLLTQSSLVNKLPSMTAPVVCLDSNGDTVSRLSPSNPNSNVAPSNLAYVIYTSGSTGKPKGVAMAHGSLVNLIGWQLQHSTVSEGAKTLQFAPVSFDVSFQEMFSTWCSGGLLVLITKELRRDARALLGFLSEHAVERLFLPFVALQHIADIANDCEDIPLYLREVITAGEQLQITPAIARWFQKLMGCTLHNHYGPSESHVVTAFTSSIPVSNWQILPPIGRPIANTQIYLLDHSFQPTPIGIPGELYIGGVCVARGYLNRPELTAEKFIKNPFSEGSNSRLYQTGDLARYLPDGNIEYLGRIDNQVKVRGFRIELSEIEVILTQHPAVREAVVTMRKDQPNDPRLVAYLVSNQGDPTQLETLQSKLNQQLVPQLRQFLQEQLPEYMVPSAFVMLEAIPLTPSGKVDRRALPPPDIAFQTLQDSYVAPQTPTEEMLTTIWAEVLGLPKVGTHDNFFEVGGHSLLATQVMSRIRDTFSVELPLRHLFDSPSITELSKQIDAAHRNNENLLAPPIKPIDRQGDIPLSFAQERLWFLDQLTPDNPFYNISTALRLMGGSLNIAALEQSLTEIVQRHETLRTSFSMKNGVPIQVVHQLEGFSSRQNIFACKNILPRNQLSVVNLPELPPEEQTIELQRVVTLEARRLFNLQRGPLFRTTLLQLQAEEYVLLLTHHHIVTDGWSMDILFHELSTLYEAFSTGAPSPLPELSIQYADFAHWQRQWLTGNVWETQLSYWQQQLADAPQVLDMPSDYPRPPVQTFRGGSEYFEITPELTQQLNSLCQQAGSVTLFMISLAAFALLLERYSGQQDILIGSPIANRNLKEIEPLIGFFVNTQALRIDLSGNPTFIELLNRVRPVTLDAYVHQDMPFDQLVETLQPERELSRNPLVQVMLAFQNAPESSLELADLTMSQVAFDIGTVRFDLEFHLWEAQGKLVGHLDYYKDLFEAATIKRLLGHFQTLLASIAANPIQPLSEYALLNEAEVHQLLVEWNNTDAGYPTDKCIHQLFEAQVERTPEAIAAVFENQQFTYLELNTKANQLAHHLRFLAVKPEVLVGICVERSVDMVIGLLGILKAGGAYVPLDPSYPQERIAFMLEDSQVLVLLTQSSLTEKLPAHQAQVVCLDTFFAKTNSQLSEENPVSGITPANLAYVIYTSGSTGKPKGVAIEHHSTVVLLNWGKAVFTRQQLAGVLASTSVCFDLSVFEIFVPLSWGGSVILVENALHLPTLSKALEITLINTVPSAITELVRTDSIPASVQVVNLAGEALKNEVVQQIYQRETVQQVFNLYGPSEDTTYSTFVLTKKGSTKSPTIGCPIANTQIYILNRHLKPTPIGVIGELHIGGDGLARGYLNRPELTAAKFIKNPFSDEPNSRLYKTGDLARYLPDSQIEYLGRIDHQVKIRGFRIELGEIEAVLALHPQVQEAVVITHQDVSGNKRLVAYLVSNATPTPNTSELRGFLTEKLPDYMLPSFFFWLEALPLTPNGKLDRRALPAPAALTNPTEGRYVAPRTTTEKILASIWADILGLEQVSVHDNFFERGGDSILSIQVIAKANQAGLQLTPKLIFQHKTIAELATVIGIPLNREAEQGEVTGDVPLTPIQQWFFEQNYPEPHHYNQAVLLESTASLNPAWLEPIVQHWLVHHDVLRLRLTKSDAVWQATQAGLEKEIPFQVVDLSNVPSHTQPHILEKVAAQQQASLNIFDGQLMRVVLFYLGPSGPSRLFIVIHHLAVDGVSWRILLEDLQTAYHQLSRGEMIQWPPKTTSFQAWSYRLTEYAQSPTVVAELDYWLSLTETTQTAPLPIDISPPPSLTSSTHSLTVTLASMAHLTVSLTAEQTRALLNEVPSVYNTQINDVLLTALVQSFAQWTGQHTLLIDLEGHGREDLFEEVDLSRTVGWFTSLFPVRLDLRFATSVGEALKSIKEQQRRIPNHGINYGLLRYLNSETSAQLKNRPQAQICFNYLGQFDQMVSGGSLFRFAKEEIGLTHSLLGNHPYPLEINGHITEGQLQLDWSYSKNLHQRATIEKRAQDFIEALKNIIAHCQSPEAGGYTPSDFPEAELSQDELDEFLDELG